MSNSLDPNPIFPCWVIFQNLLSSANLFSSKIMFSKNSFGITIAVSNSLDPDQAKQNVGPDLGPNCSQRLSSSRQNLSLAVKELRNLVVKRLSYLYL